MKPIIIIKEKNANGKFELTEQELKGLIEQAYAQGVEDGKPPKKPLPQNQYDRPEEGILHRNIIHDVYGNPYCVSTESDPKDNQAVATDDLVYRPSTAKWARKAEPIPCELNKVSSNPNPSITAWSTATSKKLNTLT